MLLAVSMFSSLVFSFFYYLFEIVSCFNFSRYITMFRYIIKETYLENQTDLHSLEWR
jgi:hypothetical protein